MTSLLPKDTIVDNDDDIRLKFANIGKLISALKQRVDFIITRDVPIVYIPYDNYVEAFKLFQETMKQFKEDITNFEDKFMEANNECHKYQQQVYGK